MDAVMGRISRIEVREEEGLTDWSLALSKVCWFGICALFPLSLFRFLNDLFGPIVAGGGILLLLLVIRLLGPFNLVMLDELLGRLFPALRSAVRTGKVRVYDFRVQQESGREIACIIRNLSGAAPMERDSVSLEGAYHLGAFQVRRGINQSTGSVIALRSSHSQWILLGTIGLVVIFSLYLSGVFDEWIYPWFRDQMCHILNGT